jgi:hypothetical protein
MKHIERHLFSGPLLKGRRSSSRKQPSFPIPMLDTLKNIRFLYINLVLPIQSLPSIPDDIQSMLMSKWGWVKAKESPT